MNPVSWQILAHHGVAVRGPAPDRLPIHLDDAQLRSWTLGNLTGYWRGWAARAQRQPVGIQRALPRRFAAGGVLGAPRLHYTLATGAIASKQAAAHYALETFDARWRPVIEEALAFWDGAPGPRAYRSHPARRLRDAGRFVDIVIDAASQL